MASSLSGGAETGRVEKHHWSSLEDYIWRHQRRLENYSGFVKEDYIAEIDPLPSDNPNISFLRIIMEIPCDGGVRLTIHKLAEIRKKQGRKIARTITYSYNASSPQGNIFRYDNAHIHPGHTTKHHKHEFNGTGRQIAGSPVHVGEKGWPNMHEVIEELIDRTTHSN